MMFDGINLVAVLVAGIASFGVGAIWYGLLSKAWMRSTGLDENDAQPSIPLFIGTFFGLLVMAFVFAGVIYHAGPVTIENGLLSAALIWTGFVAMSMAINHRYQKLSWSLTFIDGGHWLAVLMAQGAVIGAFG